MENIAVIGIANLFPGSSQPSEFWQQLLKKHDKRTKISAQKMGVPLEDYFGSIGEKDKFYCLYGGYITDFEFDSQPFLLTKSCLERLDDTTQWGLYVTHQALKHSGYWGSAKLKNCGLILGNLSFPTSKSNHLFLPFYHHVVESALKQVLNPNFQLKHHTQAENVHADNALISGYPSTLLAKASGLGGAHFSLDAACASSCYSTKLACDYLHTGKADMMLAGAISGADPMFINMGFSIFHAFPKNNKQSPFDKDSQGLFASEGAGMMVLKRHSDALHDGDIIHAIIKGGGLSNDGKGEFVLSPNSKGQVLAYERAYENANVNPCDVDYIECHATGTPKGDKVELHSLETFFSRVHKKPLLSSAKSNLGHLLTAAGMPSMIKAMYALNEGKIPATINLKTPINTKQKYLTSTQIPTESIDWKIHADKIRTAGVSVFGFGGSNAHLVLQGGNVPLNKMHPKPKASMPMSIIGMDCIVGSVCNLSEFKTLINNNESTFSALPKNRWRGLEKNQKIKQILGLKDHPIGGYVAQFDIDLLRFKIPPNQSDCLIPQQLMMLKVADLAAIDAGLDEGANVAVLVAMGIELELHQYRGRLNLTTQIKASLLAQGISLTADEQNELIDIVKLSIAQPKELNAFTSFIGNIMASRLSALWNFSGPAFTVSNEENSVYRCVELAQNLFQTSDVEAVIIASVDLAGSFENISLRQRFGRVNEQAQSPVNILDAQQWLVGEGAGAFVVKPSNKVQDQQVYASIDGVAFETGISVKSINLAANKACALANIKPQNVRYVEASASGFVAENSIEKTSLPLLYPHATIDSVKRQVGHLFNASGMMSIIKSALVLDEAGAPQHIAINGLGKDENSAHLILSSTKTRHIKAKKLVKQNTRSLIRTIELGGMDIKQSILHHADSALFKTIKRKMSRQTLKPILNRVKIPVMVMATDILTQASDHDACSQDKPINKLIHASVAKPLSSASLSAQETNRRIKINSVIFRQTQTHQAFIRARHVAGQQISTLIKYQAKVLNVGNPISGAVTQSDSTALRTQQQTGALMKDRFEYDTNELVLVENFNKPEHIIYDTEVLVEFAEGKISNVFGDEYKIIDNYARRVRLPTTDYLLVSRVIAMDAKIHEYKKSSMVTEYDIPVDAPFLIDGQIPWSVAVESGQCDLMLISYIGIDFQNKSERIYRLLDCQLTFLEDMAFGGETLRYEIHIDSYAKNAGQLLFFFHYDCYVGAKKVLIMRNGCAGFFTDKELADGKGIIANDKDKAQLRNAKKSYFKPLIENSKTRYQYADMLKLVHGDLAGCFGRLYDQKGRNPSLKFASQKFLMIDCITKIDKQGGIWGLGFVEAHKDLDPNDWYFPCHFKGDQVMAGSLMSEGCCQLSMFLMLWLGMNSTVNNARFQPLHSATQTVRCRGQVLPQINTLIYRLEVFEIGMLPRPFIKANIDIILDNKVIVDFKNLCMEIKDQEPNSQYSVPIAYKAELVSAQHTATRSAKAINEPLKKLLNRLESDLDGVNRERRKELKSYLFHVNSSALPNNKDPLPPLMRVETDHNASAEKGVLPIKHFAAPMIKGQNRQADTLPFTPYHLFEFATGYIAKCFGSAFDVYKGRRSPRLPCGELQLLTRVIDVQGKRLIFKDLASCTAQYYVPIDAWYFRENSVHNWMPYSVIMEIALQPNGFLSAYIGASLIYPKKDLFYRNLDGDGELVKILDLRGKTIVNKSVLINTSQAGGMIIQSFNFNLLVDNQVFYKGSAVFGFFTAEALTTQVGMDNGKITSAWFDDNNTSIAQIETLNLTNKALQLFKGRVGKPHYHLPGGKLNFVDTVSIVEGGGTVGIAYIYGERMIKSSDWFFRCHFHNDPVMPGSLGIEALIELLQTYALKNDLGAQFKNPRFVTPLSKVIWKYRGQITPLDKKMSIDVHISDITKTKNEVRIMGDANLYKDGLRIYHVKELALSIIES
ncbi:MAG: 3-hydroxyacyl-[acyl-carrier-protein] dehydratase FabA [Psychromonas sp.]|nr:3-hydroxyacyl-[acyl-carrier-protein] dehydratase FabA [Psychromonas sp.]